MVREPIHRLRAIAVTAALVLAAPVPAESAAGAEAWLSAAESGDAEAQYQLGLLSFFADDGSPETAAEAIVWFRRSAEQGLPIARYRLGLARYRGRGMQQDYAQAYKWFRLCVDRSFGDSAAWLDRVNRMINKQERADAEFLIAHAYGDGTAGDPATGSIDRWRRLAQSGYPEAQFRLGQLLSRRDSTERDIEDARMWLQRSVDQGYDLAGLEFERLDARLAPDRIDAAIERARRTKGKKR